MRKTFMHLCATAALVLAAVPCLMAETITFHGVRNTMRYDDGDDAKYTYLGWNEETQKAEGMGDYGTWTLTMDGSKMEAKLDHYENLMYGNSGALYINGIIYTFFSHEDPNSDDADQWSICVRKWDAKTYEKLSQKEYPKSSNLESRGLAYNPKDGKVYGLFYLTDVQLPVGEEELDQEDREEGYITDAGYALCTLDLETMKITQITPGIYYDNFVTLACSPEGRIFSMTSSGTMVEFSPKTGLVRSKAVINEYGETEHVYYYETSGAQSQFKRQSACFDHKSGKMYWNGFVNSGKGINDWGSWSTLSDKEWRTNGKYDTSIYEVDINTGKATMIGKVPNRIAFSCLWVEGADGTDVKGDPTWTPDETGWDQNPTPVNPDKPIRGDEEGDDEKPGTGSDDQPGTGSDDQPGTGNDDKPGTGNNDKPNRGDEEGDNNEEGINDIYEDAPVLVFDLMGRPADIHTQGVVIVKKGNETFKHIIY